MEESELNSDILDKFEDSDLHIKTLHADFPSKFSYITRDKAKTYNNQSPTQVGKVKEIIPKVFERKVEINFSSKAVVTNTTVENKVVVIQHYYS